MKATPVVCAPKPAELSLRNDQYRVNKRCEASDAEIAACLLKLKDMVPTVPLDQKISKVQLLQHVIDYIMDLELTLGTCADSCTSTPQLLQAAVSERKPLADMNTCFRQEMTSSSHSESEQMDCLSTSLPVTP